MNIIVCVKQVPGTTEVEVDEKTGVLKRDGVQSKLNPYDLFALETAFDMAEKKGAGVTALTMGPPQAEESLRETLYMGADRAVLVTDRKFGGSDVCATSYAISSAIKRCGEYSLIVCGKQTTDGDTAQVGPEVAEMLGIEHAANVCEVKELDDAHITVRLNLDDVFVTQTMKLPCLITIDKDANTPRLPSYKRKRAVTDDRVTVLTAADLAGADESRFGLKGSPTQVERIFPPDKNSDKEIMEGSSAELSDALFSVLSSRKFI